MLQPLSQFFGIRFLAGRSALPYVLPFYHCVSDEACPHIANLYPMRSVRQFEADIDYLCKHFEPASLSEIRDLAAGEALRGGKKKFHLTFDDGLRQCYEVVRPILLRKGIPATFFINSKFVDNQALMYRYAASLLAGRLPAGAALHPLKMGYAERDALAAHCEANGVDIARFLAEYRPYCSLEQLRGLAADGFVLGSHSYDHPLYAKIDLDTQVAQTIDAQLFIEREVYAGGLPADFLRVFAFPFTDDGVGVEFWRWLGARMPFDLTFGTAGIKSDSIGGHLQRLPMETGATAGAILKKNFFAHWLKRILGRAQVQHH